MCFFVVFEFKYGGMGDQGMIDGGKNMANHRSQKTCFLGIRKKATNRSISLACIAQNLAKNTKREHLQC